MIYDCMVGREINGSYYLELTDGNKLSWDEVKQLLDTENGKKTENDRLIMYSIKTKDIDVIDKNKVPSMYRLRVRKDHINAYKEFVEDIESRCFKEETNSIIKKINFKEINWKRLAIIGLCTVLVASLPGVIKASKDALKEDQEDWIKRNSAPSHAYENPNLNPDLDKHNEDIKSIQEEEALTEKYDILLTRALNGDSDALKEIREQAFSDNDAAQKALVNYLYATKDDFKSKSR